MVPREKALNAVKIEWDLGENARVSSSDIEKMLDEGLEATEAFSGNVVGDVDTAISRATKTVSATYSYPTKNMRLWSQ
ncbi:hypothetical protein P4S63_13500 [Pseudoalteromonas sp. B193]